MGVRVAKLEDEEIWIVYQSVTDACFVPMFWNELAANLYAYHYSHLGLAGHDWGKEYHVGHQVHRFLMDLLGEEPQENSQYDELLTESGCRGRGDRVMRDLYLSFIEWRKDEKTKPTFKLEKEEEEL